MNFLQKSLFNLNNFINPQKKEEKPIKNFDNSIPNDEKYIINYYVQDLLHETVWNGDKFPDSFGRTKDYIYIDYYTLRRRSMQLFKENSYAYGMIQRLITNEIYKGINLEANPIASIIGFSEDKSIEWAENIEMRWNLWCKDNSICDYWQINNFAKIQMDLRQTALISGDCLVILRVNRKTGLPCIELIDGANVQTPFNAEPSPGNYIKHGIEFDSQKRHIAYWIYVDNGKGIYGFERIPCWGEKSKRRIAWLVYGGTKTLDECRGTPILAMMLYMLKELDRGMDAETRAFVINAMLPMFMKRTEKSPGAALFGQGAKKHGEIQNGTETHTHNYNITQQIVGGLPGMVPDELPYGVEPVSFNTQRPNVNIGKFREIILETFAFVMEVPPEILRLIFQSNYSASRQANNELQIYIDKRSWLMGCDFLQNVYEEWVIANIINGKIQANGLLDAWYSGNWELYNAWLNAEWTGLSRPSVDGLKDAQTSKELLQIGISNFDIESRRNTGMRFRPNAQKLRAQKKYMENLGLISSVDENTSGEPVQQNAAITAQIISDNIIENINQRGNQ